MKRKNTSNKKIFIKGSKIPINFFFDYIKDGYTISDFLSSYPWIKKDDLIRKLEEFEEKEISSRYAV